MFQPSMILWNHLWQYIETERQAQAGQHFDLDRQPLARLGLSSRPARFMLGLMAGIVLFWPARIAVLG